MLASTLSIKPNRIDKYNTNRTSLFEAKEKYNNLEKSELEFISNPSAILFEIDTVALYIWSTKEKSLLSLKIL